MPFKVAYILILILCTFTLHAQINLVPNPSFEEADTCSTSYSFPISDTIDVGKRGKFRNPHHWYSSSYSPDYYKSCNDSAIVKSGFYQMPKSGSAMTGVLAYSNDFRADIHPFNGLKENLGVKLTKKLIAGEHYKVIYFVNLANYSNKAFLNTIATTSMGAHLSIDKPTYVQYPSKSLYPIEPQVINDSNRYLMDTLGWDKVEGLYLANGGEEWLTIGDFGNRNRDTILNKDFSQPISSFIYYFIDDVSVTYFDTTSHTTDTMLCNGRSLIFSKRPDWDSCVWYDGSHDSSKVFTQTGEYWVTNFYASFIVTDTLRVTFTDSLPTEIYNTGFCAGDSVLLTARNAQAYVWSNGKTTQQCYAAQADTFFVIGTTNGCKVTDSFYVQAYANPIINGLKDTIVCFDDIGKVRLDGGEHYTYLWQPTGETTRTIYSTQAMLYTLTVTDTTLCKASAQVAVDEECAIGFYIPNAFSPNGDGVNEELRIVIPLGKLIRFEVYNRWGQLVESNTTGTWNGNQAPDGVYVLSITYFDHVGQKQQAKGNVTLLR
jgi:gliding motility-associated-like protein